MAIQYSGGFQKKCIFPYSWDDDPIWRTHIFQGGGEKTPTRIGCQSLAQVLEMLLGRVVAVSQGEKGQWWVERPAKNGGFNGFNGGFDGFNGGLMVVFKL